VPGGSHGCVSSPIIYADLIRIVPGTIPDKCHDPPDETFVDQLIVL
jgi:hypothetical protein